MKFISNTKYKKCLFTIIIIFLVIILIYSTLSIKSTKEGYSITEKRKIDKRLEKLDYINEKISYFNNAYINRYISFKEKNPNLSNEKIVTYVNIGIDNSFYTHIKKAQNLNKNTILVNKYHYLPQEYIPEGLESISLDFARSGMKLVKEAKDAYEAMARDALNDNLKLIVTSSYRSYEYQEKLYNNYAKKDGNEKADTYSGRPGYSEHQTGLAIDIHNGKEVYTNFENTEEFKWMQNNAYKYGFILRFPKDKEFITGYEYESWHYRYVGLKIAEYIHNNNITFEEYYAMFIDINN